MFEADREGGYTGQNALFYVFLARSSRNEQTRMKKRNFQVCDDEVPTVFQSRGEYISESKINYGSLAH